MAPNTSHLAGDVCLEESRTGLASMETFERPAVGAASAALAPAKQDDVVIFFDWDDTLMASSAIAKLGLCPKYVNDKPAIPADVQQELSKLEDSVLDLLETALLFGRVVIVTAAEAGWVELSASLFLPRVAPLMHSKVKVVSARSTYEYLYPDCPRRWKIEAFNHEVFPVWETFEDETAKIPRHVISLGDGPTEREALINVKMQAMERCHSKSMKFITYPKIDELRLELELITANLDNLCTHEGDLDLQITWEMLGQE